MKRSLIPAMWCAGLALFSALSPAIAEADGGGRWHGGGHRHSHGGGSRVGIGVWLGAPIVLGAPYYSPYYYGYGPPVVREYIYEDRGYAAPIAPPAPTWYYCREAGRYYPYVQDCPEGWEAVPARPPAGSR